MTLYMHIAMSSSMRLLNGQAKVALYTVILLQPCSVVCGEVYTYRPYLCIYRLYRHADKAAGSVLLMAECKCVSSAHSLPPVKFSVIYMGK